MLDWLTNNWGTLIVLAVVAVAMITVFTVMRKDKKKGVSSCGCSCQNCAMNCHGVHNDKAEQFSDFRELKGAASFSANQKHTK